MAQHQHVARTDATVRRLQREFNKLRKEAPVDGLHLEQAEKDKPLHWKGSLRGPEGSPYAGGTFQLDMHFPEDYPFSPPIVRFSTQIWHPNVFSTGRVCLDILDTNWSATYTAISVLASIQSLLSDPNPDDPANGPAARQFTQDRRAFEAKARELTRLHAQEPEVGQKRKHEHSSAPPPEPASEAAAAAAPGPAPTPPAVVMVQA
eukprot:TRINITY_DN50060_c0_g1_i1.p1 TRINITY_DN50060_c0_g1~~TRINITY_DN50060_c0_g1_i1.p1  ORF type:complete len:236 (+),score=43.71 TRINITY_DN50060_c0_g1_i1:96-710(+)